MRHSDFFLYNVSKQYPNYDYSIRDISFHCRPYSFTALLGPSGCGKSTILRLLMGLDNTTEGKVLIGGKKPGEFNATGRMGAVFQEAALLPWLNTKNNILFPLRFIDKNTANYSKNHINNIIRRTGLQGSENAFPAELSGGMLQRVALARALITDPAVLILDEPFSSLDYFTRQQMNCLLERTWLERRPTTLLVTHDIDEAIILADTIIVMSGQPGRIIHKIKVPFQHPRSPDILLNKEAIAIKAKILNLLQQKSQRFP
ncbi:MAG: ABC transporter ATP-binding protein [Thiolinea sp.]